jgi:hypothetical protein
MTDQRSGSVVLVEDDILPPAHRREIAAWRNQYDRATTWKRAVSP